MELTKWKRFNLSRKRMFLRIFLSSVSISCASVLILGLFSTSYATGIVRKQANKGDTLYLHIRKYIIAGGREPFLNH